MSLMKEHACAYWVWLTYLKQQLDWKTENLNWMVEILIDTFIAHVFYIASGKVSEGQVM